MYAINIERMSLVYIYVFKTQSTTFQQTQAQLSQQQKQQHRKKSEALANRYNMEFGGVE